jgi:hypothetical protein
LISEHCAACQVTHGIGMRLVHPPSMGTAIESMMGRWSWL